VKRLTIKLLLPIAGILSVFLLVAELVWLPLKVSDAVNEKVDDTRETLNLLAELVKYNQSTETALQQSLSGRLFTDRSSWLRVSFRRTNNGVPSPPVGFTTHRERVHLSVEVGAYVADAWLDKRAIAQEVTKQFRWTESLIIVSSLLTFFVIALLQRWLLFKPMTQLIEAAEHLGSGRSEFPFPAVTHRSILSPLIRSFITMRGSLLEQQHQMESQVQERRLAEERLNESHRIAQLGCWEWLLKEQRFWVSTSLQAILLIEEAYPKNAQSLFQRVHPADRSEVMRHFTDMLNKGQAGTIDFRVSTPTGVYRHVHLICHVVHNAKGDLKRISGTCQDITDRKHIESSLQKLSSAITHSGSSVMITDVIGTIEYVNPKYTETTGYSLADIQGNQPELLSRKWISPDRYEALWQSILSGKHWRGELQSRRKDGTTFWSLVSISPIHNEYGELTHFVIVCEDVTELKDAHARMERLALYDELTGLPNRRFFFRELAALFEQDTQEFPSVVMLLDLDYFKTVNDTQGHSVGDQLLIQVAQRLVDTLQDNDIAARLGGDEFAILIHPVQEAGHVERVAQRILAEISRPFLINDHEVQISTSLGLAWLPKDGQSPEALLKHADLAMYQAKEMGRNQFRFFTESLHEQLQTYIRFSREMPKSLEDENFYLLYQPQVDLKTSKIISVEALVRWNHPELGIVSPLDFISIAEETGFIVPLGRWVLSTACRALRELSDLQYDDVRIAINLSSRQFRDPELLNMIRQALHRYRIDPARLELEITETLLMQDIDLAISTLTELQQLGVTVAIDDFGIGYSSFNYLKTLPINVLKVDREFIKDIPDHLDDMEITAAIISMAHRLKMKVVAEGIETDVQKVFLEEHHCDVGQGYLFSKPVSLDELFEQLALQHV